MNEMSSNIAKLIESLPTLVEFDFFEGIPNVNDGEDSEYLATFHPEETYNYAPEDDNYHFGSIRANHYIVSFGYCEKDDKKVVLIIGNHKGYLSAIIKERKN